MEDTIVGGIRVFDGENTSGGNLGKLNNDDVELAMRYTGSMEMCKRLHKINLRSFRKT